MPRLSKIGAAALAAFGWSSGGATTVTASYLVVAGGGAGGGGVTGNIEGGGGAGGLLTGAISLNPTLSYTVTVGAGGAGATTAIGASGSNSSFSAVATTAIGGGGGAGYPNSAGNGGSGGGAGYAGGTFGTGTAGQGNNGANGSGAYWGTGGGGGGAGSAGVAGGTYVAGDGGTGSASSITGSSVTYAGGGGGGIGYSQPTFGLGGSGIGGNGGGNVTATSGNINTGSGGGGACTTFPTSGSGGSGIVIISYAGAQQFGGGVVTSVGGNTIHTFNTSGTLSPITSLSASYLVVAGGGSASQGGGGAGGMLTGSGLVIDANSTYVVTVGAGGAGGSVIASGTASSFSLVSTTAVGGGFGGILSNGNGANGGSGGGASWGGSGVPGVGTAGQGNNGGTGRAGSGGVGSGDGFNPGGGGGAGAAGQNAIQTKGGNGGNGLQSSITGTATYYAGGGGGSTDQFRLPSGATSTGGLGGGGNGVLDNTSGQNGTANTGGGGGGGATNSGGSGGSGIVIISYAGTQQMAGGTVTSVGGNTIHTFTSSGYLTPIKLVNRSLRFRSSANARLTRTYTATGSAQKFTASMWVKRGILSSNQTLFGAQNTGAQTWDYFNFNSSDQLQLFIDPGTTPYNVITSSVFRDPSAWYHVVCAVDTTQATASNRVRIYVNGVEQPLGTNTIPQNYNLRFNVSGNTAGIATEVNYANTTGPVRTLDGYLADINWIDGQQLTPSSFGGYNSYGVWQPAVYGGSYGTNGFYLPFTNTTSTTTLGYDFSPNGNNWTTNNISLTAGSTYDSMTDVPTLTSATAANYCTWNPLDTGASTMVASNANLTFTKSGVNFAPMRGTIAVTSDKYYFEMLANGNLTQIGVSNGYNIRQNGGDNSISASGGIGAAWDSRGYLYSAGAAPSYGYSFTTGDVVMVAFDASSGKIWFGKNGTWNTGDPATGTTPAFTASGYNFLTPFANGESGGSGSANFGQRPFTYTPPSGFVALNTYNL